MAIYTTNDEKKQNRNTRDAETRESSETTRVEEEIEFSAKSITDPLWIPKSVKDDMLSKGYKLRWVRVGSPNDPDYQNINRKMASTFTWVKPEEVPKLNVSTFRTDIGHHQNLVCRGDVALAKIRIENNERLKEVKRSSADAMLAAVDHQLSASKGFYRGREHKSSVAKQSTNFNLPILDD